MKKLFLGLIGLTYISCFSILIHAFMMNSFSAVHNFYQGCMHMQESQEIPDSHTSCIETFHIGFNIISPININFLFGYIPFIFKETNFSSNLFIDSHQTTGPPIIGSFNKFLKFSDLVGIIVLLS